MSDDKVRANKLIDDLFCAYGNRAAVDLVMEALRQAHAAGRRDGIEAAAKRCDLIAVKSDDGDDTLADECARQIRALSAQPTEETK